TLRSGAGKSSLRACPRWPSEPSSTASITIHTHHEFSTKRVCDLMEATLHEDRKPRLFPTRYEMANSIADLLWCCARNFWGVGQASVRRSTAAAYFISGAK